MCFRDISVSSKQAEENAQDHLILHTQGRKSNLSWRYIRIKLFTAKPKVIFVRWETSTLLQSTDQQSLMYEVAEITMLNQLAISFAFHLIYASEDGKLIDKH